jgi:AhpD family alkylhydroperoxidase
VNSKGKNTSMNAAPKQISRLPALPEPPSDPIAAEMFRKIEVQGRSILNVHRMSLHSPKFFHAQATYAGALRHDITLPRTLCEMVIVRTARLQNCPYVESVHARMAREAGVSDARLAALDKWETSDLFDKREKAALSHAELMATDGKSVDDAAFVAASAVFTPQEVMELSTLCGYYIGNCRCLNALGLVSESGDQDK